MVLYVQIISNFGSRQDADMKLHPAVQAVQATFLLFKRDTEFCTPRSHITCDMSKAGVPIYCGDNGQQVASGTPQGLRGTRDASW